MFNSMKSLRKMRTFLGPNDGGFTLVELLIVIVIIGILAGVVIGVLNPVQQQNRARDGTLRSAISKAALAGKSLFVSSPRNTQRAPTYQEFAGSVGTLDVANSDCDDNVGGPGVTGSCLFRVTALDTPTNCDATNYNGVAAPGAQCSFVYYKSPTLFRIGVRGFATPERLFVYSFEESATGAIIEGFWACPTTFAIATSPSSPTCDRV
ncbi:MAG TPA: prepilin-type N-terminal cleavage/methylation domain-containing protein [Patescibacteria group bacterium]|nr:prepilin-type N-terminal cleavage/methylation domain-containing protein [Patescibacteria group bacterium]